jgi:hypothetical protein
VYRFLVRVYRFLVRVLRFREYFRFAPPPFQGGREERPISPVTVAFCAIVGRPTFDGRDFDGRDVILGGLTG